MDDTFHHRGTAKLRKLHVRTPCSKCVIEVIFLCLKRPLCHLPVLLPSATDLRLSTLERQGVLCVGSGQYLQRGMRAVEDWRDATVEIVELSQLDLTFIHLQMRDKFSSETGCHIAKVRATRAVLLPDLLEKTIFDRPLLRQVSICAKRAQKSQSRAVVHVALVHKMFVRMHPSVSNASPSHLRIIDDVIYTHITPTNNASILSTHVHENACLLRGCYPMRQICARAFWNAKRYRVSGQAILAGFVVVPGEATV